MPADRSANLQPVVHPREWAEARRETTRRIRSSAGRYAKQQHPPKISIRHVWAGGTVDPMALSDCYFETERLVVDDWSRVLSGNAARTMRDNFVESLLTEAVTSDLPPGWQGRFDRDRAASWFADRQSESTVRLIVNRSDGRPVGLLILSESSNSERGLDIRLGYIMAEDVWGCGLATEVVAGAADWCRIEGTIWSVVGAVADGNSASARVLEKNGFVPYSSGVDLAGDAEVEYRLTFAT